MFKVLCFWFLVSLGAAIGGTLGASVSVAKELVVNVSNQQGRGLANIVVYMQAVDKVATKPPTDVAIMDQIDTQFSPHILAVQKNSLVKFPNSDSIKHHVYSFSAAKTFELQLYKDLQADPLLFSKEGVVELGCNVHDWMLGYIFIVDSPYFGKSDAKGQVKLNVPEGEYTLKVWSPLIQDDINALTTQLFVSEQSPAQHIRLKKPLLPNLLEYENSDEFENYD